MVCADCWVNVPAAAIGFDIEQFGAVDIAGNVNVPVDAVPPAPTLTVKDAVPFAVMTGDVPKPDAIVGAVADTKVLPVTPFPNVLM